LIDSIPDLGTHSRENEGGISVGRDVDRKQDLPVVVLIPVVVASADTVLVATEFVVSVIESVPNVVTGVIGVAVVVSLFTVEVVTDGSSSAVMSSTSTAWHSSEASAPLERTTRSSPCRQNPSTPGIETLPLASTLISTGASGFSSWTVNLGGSASSSRATYWERLFRLPSSSRMKVAASTSLVTSML
jgi:hypothetical protein